jgi:outer membrane protein TolC
MDLRNAAVTLLCLAVVLGLGAVCVSAEESPGAEAHVITVEKAVELAGDNNLALQAARLELQHAEKQLIKAQADAAVTPSPVALRQAEVEVEVQRILLEQARSQVDLEVRSAYYGVLSQMQKKAIAEKSLAQAEEHLEIITTKAKEGLATKLDLVNAEKNAIQAKAALEAASAEEELAVLELKRVIGLAYSEPISIELSEVEPEPIDLSPEKVVERVLASSLELLRLQWALEISQLQEESARNEYTAPLLKDIYTNRRMKAELDLRQATRSVYLEAKRAWNNLKQAQSRVKLAEKELEAAQENYRITKSRFDGGLEIPNNLLRAQIDLTSAEHALVTAIFEYNLARIRLLNLMGE